MTAVEHMPPYPRGFRVAPAELDHWPERDFCVRSSHRAIGLPIKMSPRSRVSPGLTVKSFRN